MFFTAGLLLMALTSCSAAPLAADSEALQVVTRQLVAKGGEVISGKHFKCSGKPYQALIVNGHNVTVKNSLFTDCAAGIIIAGKYHTVITGNRFERVGVAIREKDHPSDTTVSYNEFAGVGVSNCTQAPEWAYHINGYWACNVFMSVGGKDGKFNHNIIDNRGIKTRWIEDFINLYGAGGGFEVMNNLIIGSSEADSSSATGGCIVVDGLGKNYRIEGNRCYNAAGYGIGNAGGNHVVAQNNTVYITKKHAMTLTHHPKNHGPGGSYSFGSTRYNGPCGKGFLIAGNKSFSHEVNLKKGQTPVDRGKPRHLLETCALEQKDNQFFDSDPGWEIPQNVFENLDARYYSGRQTAQ